MPRPRGCNHQIMGPLIHKCVGPFILEGAQNPELLAQNRIVTSIATKSFREKSWVGVVYHLPSSIECSLDRLWFNGVLHQSTTEKGQTSSGLPFHSSFFLKQYERYIIEPRMNYESTTWLWLCTCMYVCIYMIYKILCIYVYIYPYIHRETG